MSVLSPKTADGITKVHSEDASGFRGISGDVKHVYYADDVTVRFGNLEQKNARMTLFDLSGTSRSFGTEISGILGADTLDMLVIHIDYRDGLMKFEFSADRGYQHFR